MVLLLHYLRKENLSITYRELELRDLTIESAPLLPKSFRLFLFYSSTFWGINLLSQYSVSGHRDDGRILLLRAL